MKFVVGALSCLLVASVLTVQASPNVDSAVSNVHGRVVQQPGGQPIRKATVQLRSGAAQYTASTDSDGTFTVREIPPGSYRISVEHAGFVETTLFRRSIVSVGAGKEVGDLVLEMQLAGLISGKIVDGDGDPLKGVQVYASAVGAGQRNRHGGAETTNDLGEFRISDLAPGLYKVSATPSRIEPPHEVEEKKQSGRVVYATTYYPGTIDKEQAAPVEVRAGNEMPITFGVLTTRVYRVSGTVQGAQTGGMGQLMLTSEEGESTPSGVNLADDGSFKFENLLPASYRAHLIVFTFTQGKPGGELISLSPSIEVDKDLDGIRLRPEPLVSLRGKFRMDRGPSPDWSQLNVTVFPIDEHGKGMVETRFERPVFSGVNRDGSFELKNVPGGRHQLTVGATASNLRDYFTKAIELNGRDVPDSGFEVQPGMLLDVVVSANGGKIEGTVTNQKGEPVAEATVVAIPEAEHRLHPDLYGQEKTDARGHFALPGLNPGEYSVLAFEELDEDIRAADFLKPHEEMSEKVQLSEGERKSVTLKVIPAQAETP